MENLTEKNGVLPQNSLQFERKCAKIGWEEMAAASGSVEVAARFQPSSPAESLFFHSRAREKTGKIARKTGYPLFPAPCYFY